MSFLQQVWPSSPNSTTKWGLNVQISGPTGDIYHANPHITKSLIRVLPNTYSSCTRLDLISFVPLMKGPMSQGIFWQEGYITWKFQTAVYRGLAEAGPKMLIWSRLPMVKGTQAKHWTQVFREKGKQQVLVWCSGMVKPWTPRLSKKRKKNSLKVTVLERKKLPKNHQYWSRHGPSTWETETGRVLWLPGQYSEFKASHSFIVRPCTQNQTTSQSILWTHYWVWTVPNPNWHFPWRETSAWGPQKPLISFWTPSITWETESLGITHMWEIIPRVTR